MAYLHTLDEVDVKGKRLLLRVDLNLPMENGRVSDATRIERVLPTIQELSEKAAKLSCSLTLAAQKDAELQKIPYAKFYLL